MSSQIEAEINSLPTKKKTKTKTQDQTGSQLVLPEIQRRAGTISTETIPKN